MVKCACQTTALIDSIRKSSKPSPKRIYCSCLAMIAPVPGEGFPFLSDLPNNIRMRRVSNEPRCTRKRPGFSDCRKVRSNPSTGDVFICPRNEIAIRRTTANRELKAGIFQRPTVCLTQEIPQDSSSIDPVALTLKTGDLGGSMSKPNHKELNMRLSICGILTPTYCEVMRATEEGTAAIADARFANGGILTRACGDTKRLEIGAHALAFLLLAPAEPKP